MPPQKSRLGRGLGSLIASGASSKSAGQKRPAAAVDASDPAASAAADGYMEIPVDRISRNPRQPRADFGEEQLKELAESIRSEGLLQPIVVRQVGDRYELIAGERRWRAFRLLGQERIPARLVKASDASSAAIALIENLQREGLNPVEEAHGYASLMRDFDLTQEAVSERVGKNRTSVANALRLLNLSEEIQGFLVRGMLSTGHAKALLGLADPARRSVLARRVIESGLSVRETERLVRTGGGAGRGKTSRGAARNGRQAAVTDLEKRLTTYLGARVHVQDHPKKGRLVVEYQGNDDLQRILERIGFEAL